MTEILRKIKNETMKITVPDMMILFCAMLSGMGVLYGNFSPFGMACLTALYMSNFTPFSVVFVIIGTILSGISGSCIRHLMALLIMSAASFAEILFKNNLRASVTCAVSVGVADILYFSFMGFDVFSGAFAMLELLVSILLISPYYTTIQFFTTQKLRRHVSEKELWSLAIAATACFSGLSYMVFPFDIRPVGIVSTFILFFSAYSFSLGACGVLGTALGLLASLANPEMLYSVGSYSVAAIVCMLCRRFGKFGIICGFILTNAVFTFYINGSEAVLINIYEILIAGGFFVMIPAKKLKEMKTAILTLLNRDRSSEAKKIIQFKQNTAEKLNRLADAFSVLSVSIKKGSCGKRPFVMDDSATVLVKNIKERVCGRCEHYSACKKAEAETDEMLLNLVSITQKRGWVELFDVPLYFKNRCYDYKRLVLECNKVYELYRVNRVWESRIEENRDLMSGQLREVSGVVKSFANELFEEEFYEDDAARCIITMLDGLGISVGDAIVKRDKNGRYAVSVEVIGCNEKRPCEREIRTVIKRVTGKAFAFHKHACDKEHCLLCYKEEENFDLSVGIARVRPGHERFYGDSYAVISPCAGKRVIVLSDGMGTGERAAKESGETVDLLQHLLLAGIDRETAIKMINSILILKSYDESFATLDLFVADLYTGEGEFVKTGGACSYMLRSNHVDRISCQALPTGIIGEMETAHRKMLLKDGDMILLASDGVADVSKDDKWLCDMLAKCSACSAQDAADIIMDRAVNKRMANEDDMTVIILKIYEK